MAYNVENFFDATDDGDDQGDPTFLPLSVKRRWTENKCLRKEGFRRYLCETLDWTQEKYERRLKRTAGVLLGYNTTGADIIVLEELENKRVIMDLWEKHLRVRGYRSPIHFESPSRRGIDVGMISRFELTHLAVVHHVDLTGLDSEPTRDIVEATFLLPNGQKLKVAANHWPSLTHTVETRLKAASVLKQLALKAQSQNMLFIATGDFNTLSSESPNPIEDNLADNVIRSLNHPFIDLQDYMGGYPYFPNRQGSHFYRGEWSPLDRILVSKNFFNHNSQAEVDLSSFGAYVPTYLLKTDYITNPKTGEKRPYIFPHRFDFVTGEGFSDHLPLSLKIKLR